MKRSIKWIFIILGAVAFIIAAFLIFIYMAFDGVLDDYHSKEELISNYKSKSKEIALIKDYINSIVPANKNIEIEFKGKRTIPIFHVIENGVYDNNWNLTMNSDKTSTLLHKLGWNKETLRILKSKLDEANCISVENGNPVTIGFQRSGMGKYYYKVFNEPLTDSVQQLYNDGCTYIFYGKNIVLEYGGGVLGSQCFEGFKIKNTK